MRAFAARPRRPLKMATVAELKTVLKDTLEKRGVLGHLKARIRAEVFSALDDDHEPRPTLSHENLLINELIREYLEFNKYKYTASVLTAESGQPAVPLDRQFLVRELNAFEESKDSKIPLLYGILAHFLHGTKDGVPNTFLKESSLQPSNPNLVRQKKADGDRYFLTKFCSEVEVTDELLLSYTTRGWTRRERRGKRQSAKSIVESASRQ
ncbi:centrosomal protein 20 isoform X2 [Marmota flaviventris]|uniref:centrosomal protein 20 isoform X2 n=1 Tax=Marmota flaviventris TaxID=93162 RepID=UPI003A83C031